MTPQQLVGLGIRLFAVWIAIGAIGSLVMLPFRLQGWERTGALQAGWAIYWYSVEGLWLAVAALLWLFPMWTAHKLIPRTRFENKLNIQPLEAARVGCSLLGLWLLLTQLRPLFSFILVGVTSRGDTSVLRAMTSDQKLAFVVMVAEIAVALVLIFGSAAFAQLVLRERKAVTD